jgi:hypothetical protein
MYFIIFPQNAVENSKDLHRQDCAVLFYVALGTPHIKLDQNSSNKVETAMILALLLKRGACAAVAHGIGVIQAQTGTTFGTATIPTDIASLLPSGC